MTARTSGPDGASARNSLVAAGFVLALWVLAHPYSGIIHDARLYALQALHALSPEKWDQDLFFKYGSQDSYSVFSGAYKWTVAALGIGPAHLVVLVAGQVLWLGAAGLLIHAALESTVERWAAVCGVAALASGYGGGWGFHYAEPFVTPRLFAEGAVLGALASAIRQRYSGAAALLGAGLVIHPLMALPGIGVAMIGPLRRDRRAWFVLGLALLAVVAGAALGIEPLARARVFYDAAWFQIVQARNGYGMMSAWGLASLLRTVAAWIVLGAFLTVARERERRWIIALLVVVIGACAVSFAGADLAHNVLIMNLQLWRALWLATLAQNAVLPLLIVRSSGSRRVGVAAGAAFGLIDHYLQLPGLIAPAMLILGVAWFLLPRLPAGRARYLLSRVVMVLGACAVAFAMYVLYIVINVDVHVGRSLATLALAAASAGGLVLWLRQPQARVLVPAMMVCVLAGLALADQRTPWNRYVYDPGPDGGLQGFLAQAGTTYWEGEEGLVALWSKAGRPSYYSCGQGAESLFFRPLALEWARRQQILRHLNTGDFGDSPECGTKADPAARGPVSQVQVVAACRALPDLDTLILNHPVPGLAGASWAAPAGQEVIEHDPAKPRERGRIEQVSTFYRYGCAGLR